MWTCKEIVTICKVSLVMVQSDGRRPGGILTLPPADSCFACLEVRAFLAGFWEGVEVDQKQEGVARGEVQMGLGEVGVA